VGRAGPIEGGANQVRQRDLPLAAHGERHPFRATLKLRMLAALGAKREAGSGTAATGEESGEEASAEGPSEVEDPPSGGAP